MGPLWAALLVCGACSSGGLQGKWPDQGGAGGRDLAGPTSADLSLSPADLSDGPLGPDLARPVDLASGGVDLTGGGVDLQSAPDLAGNRVPCLRGTGFTAFRFRYNANGGTSAQLEVFGLPDNSNWQATPVFATTIGDQANGGGLVIQGGNYILIRYSVVGISRINSATLSVFGRSYNTGASGSFEAWTPAHGTTSTPQNSFSNAWPYTWSSLDFTGYVQPGDTPGLTGIRLYARGGSSSLVINRVELCLDAQ